jgi:2-keto-4-pentenoate hydratase/2-oxohepta-3-ene-1,7-dioic acid hydratase in catechol pathway
MNYYSRILHKNQILWAEFQDGKYFQLEDSILEEMPRLSSSPLEADQVKVLSPYFGQKVIALAYNYKSLVGKCSGFDEPLVFFKSPQSVIACNEAIIYPRETDNVWIEAELTIVVGKLAKNVSADQADDYILGYTCGNDITAENILARDWHLARSKGLDTFCPSGPFLVKNIDTSDLAIESFINGKQTQNSRTSDRVLNDQESLALASKYFTLLPGDIILTGTPGGATDAVIQRGDEVEILIQHIGSLKNKVI